MSRLLGILAFIFAALAGFGTAIRAYDVKPDPGFRPAGDFAWTDLRAPAITARSQAESPGIERTACMADAAQHDLVKHHRVALRRRQ